MKKLIFMYLLLLLCGVVEAQNIEVTLNDGSVVKGEIKENSFNVDNDHEFRIKNVGSGERTDYTTADVKALKVYDKKENIWIDWIPMTAQMGLSMSYKTTPKCYKNPVFLRPVYEGENISAYVHYITTNAHTKTTSISGFAVMFYYKAKNEDFARSYYLSDNSVVGIGQKTMLKMYFKGFPQMKEILKDLSMKEIRNDPVLLVKRLDEILSETLKK